MVAGASRIRWPPFGGSAYPGRLDCWPPFSHRWRPGPRRVSVATDAAGPNGPHGRVRPFSDRFRSSWPACLLDLLSARPEQKGAFGEGALLPIRRAGSADGRLPWIEKGRAAGCPRHASWRAKGPCVAVAPPASCAAHCPTPGCWRHAAVSAPEARSAGSGKGSSDRAWLLAAAAVLVDAEAELAVTTRAQSSLTAWRSRYGARPHLA